MAFLALAQIYIAKVWQGGQYIFVNVDSPPGYAE
jgi:hypothetical protein